MSLADKYPEIAKQWHPTKNGTLTPYDVFSSSRTKVWWLCPNSCSYGCAHEWEMTPRARTIAKKGCKYCASRTTTICIHQSIVFTHPELAKEWHPTKNGLLRPEHVSSGSGKKVWWMCDKTCTYGCAHEWDALVHSRCLAKTGCPYCSNLYVCVHNSFIGINPKFLQEIHPTKNESLIPEKLSRGSSARIWWICKINKYHIWIASVNSRNSGQGCPICINKTEKRLYDIIYSKYPDTIHNYKATWCSNPHTNSIMPYDIYIPSHKLIIELDGPHHFEQVHIWNPPEETVRRDVLKMKYALEHGLTVIRCVQAEYYKDTESVSEKHLVPLIKSYDKPCVIYNTINTCIYSNHKQLFDDLII